MSAADLTDQIEALRSEYEAGTLAGDEFEARARDLAGRLAAIRADAAALAELQAFLKTRLGAALAAGLLTAWRVYAGWESVRGDLAPEGAEG